MASPEHDQLVDAIGCRGGALSGLAASLPRELSDTNTWPGNGRPAETLRDAVNRNSADTVRTIVAIHPQSVRLCTIVPAR